MIFITIFASALIFSNAINIQDEWQEFKIQFGKKYATFLEEEARFKIFTENKIKSLQRNIAEKEHGGTAVHGVTQFSDLTIEEFREQYFGLNPSQDDEDVVEDPQYKMEKPIDLTLGLVDWTSTRITPVKSQTCGSCWAHSAVEQIESDIIKYYKTKYVLSPAQVTQCSKADGCKGGNIAPALQYVMDVGGIELEADYTFPNITKADSGTCTVKKNKFIGYTVTAKYQLAGADAAAKETAMTQFVQNTGPIAHLICADDLQGYKGGILTSCPTNCTVNHAVQAVGVNARADSTGYWKIRNSWGVKFGEEGFVRIAYGANMCKIANSGGHYTHVGPRV